VIDKNAYNSKYGVRDYLSLEVTVAIPIWVDIFQFWLKNTLSLSTFIWILLHKLLCHIVCSGSNEGLIP
jgi:hypothetical protein